MEPIIRLGDYFVRPIRTRRYARGHQVLFVRIHETRVRSIAWQAWQRRAVLAWEPLQ